MNLITSLLEAENPGRNQIKTGVVTLIHKGGVKHDLGNLRPISLLRTDYKIIAKLVTTRMKTSFDKILNTSQTGESDRKITTNLCNIRNVLINKENKQTTIISLDFE